ncbi:MAG: PadR family transcriptional regulator [Microbacteriaceae bacterium]
MELTSAELTVLGLVIEQSRHGYDVEQVIEQRGIRQWTDIGFSSIYYLLAKLEKRGFIEVEQKAGGAKSRRVFRATAEGAQFATKQTLAFISEHHTVQHPILAGLANLPLLADGDYEDSVRVRLTQVVARIESVTRAMQSQSPLPHPAREIFSYSLSHLEAERMWLAERVEAPHE